jgi:integrase
MSLRIGRRNKRQGFFYIYFPVIDSPFLFHNIKTKIKNYSFKELAEEYAKWSERQRCFSRKIYMIKQLTNEFGQYPLRRFDTRMVEQFQTEQIQKGYKPATVNRLVATLKHMFTKATEWNMVEEETLKRVRKAKLLEENNRRLRYLNKEECQTLINACTSHLRPIVVTALNTGMRKEEILNLKWDNIDLKNGFILLSITKNGERREVPINGTLHDTIAGIIRRVDVPYVFYDKESSHRYGNIRRSFMTACRKANIRDFHFHDLRHTFASQLVMAGIDLTTVKRIAWS